MPPAGGMGGRPCASRPVQPVARPPDGLDEAGVGGVVLHLVPDTADVDGDGGAVSHVFIADRKSVV